MELNTAAQSLGRLGRGKKKTLSKEAIQQRKKAARISAKKRKGVKTGPRGKNAPQEIVVESAVTVEEISQPIPAPAEIPTEPVPYIQEPCQPPENAENKEKDISLTETVPSDISAFNERKHLLA